MKNQKGFTLVELMVVIVIIGILAALAIPRMMDSSKKAKAAEVPAIIKSWETLQEAWVIERSSAGTADQIGWSAPRDTTNWVYSATASRITATVISGKDVSDKCTGGSTLYSEVNLSGGQVTSFTHDGTAGCKNLVPNFAP